MIEDIIRNYFEEIPGVISVDLFGSYAKNNQNEQSDVDLAVLWKYSEIPSSLNLIALREELASLIHKDVDLVCLNTASPILGMQVAKNRKSLMLKNSREYAKYQMELFTDYAKLKTIRAPMESEILKRKVL